MSLGVLNNLSAVYAENSLNNTNSSLSKTLQQLSSGSRINSGADDAAGLSLVDGLQANQQALNQSETNAQEGVGLLQVADGALSQVTNLLDRAVTLATEVSNGTLNGTQETAANQEYQSILSEIDNIGSTTTYNQETVFGGNFGIYTGDSSSQSASVNNLAIGDLSSGSVGQAGGAMSYTAGNSLFIDMSTAAGVNAQSTDALAASGTLAVTYGMAEVGGALVTGTTVITPTTNTIGGLVDAINESGLGISAQFTTAGAAGAAAPTNNAEDTGIMISGNVSLVAPAHVGQVEIAQGATAIEDSSTSAGALMAGGNGVATIGYAGNAGENLSATNLTSQAGAEASLTDLNTAISDVASQDGYIGAQINTLNAVNNVLSTQAENVESAQNAIQATDYAAASSNMSKYEVLSQTGIAALAQANSMQQEVVKLLQ